ncbi:MAG TPA: hypothetical protein VMZ53_33185 [Kofleriaceae bacterium]|nr:hypothetical protein [Kofleriaceae bacterium]
MNLKKLLQVSTGLLFIAGAASTAFADDEAGASADANAEATVSTDPNAAGGAGAGMDANATASVDAGAGLSMLWPQSVIDRPYVVPAGTIGVGASLGVAKASFTFVDPVTGMSSTTSATGEGMGITAAYGISDALNAGVSYGFSLHEFEIKGPLTVYGAFKLAHSAKMSVAASASFTYDVGAETKGINAGLGLRYNVAPKIAVFTGAPFGPGPVGEHLSLSLDSDGPISFDVFAGAGLQATPQAFVYLSTNVAHINISNDATGIFGADFVPIQLGGQFSVNKNIDAQAAFILPDLKNAKFDLFAFTVGATYYVGK